MSIKPLKIGLIGSGAISYTYLNTLTSGFSAVEVVGCSDLIPERSKARAELFGIRQMTTEEILADPEIELVLNTTQLWNHHHVTKAALEAGKHVYSEKAMDHTLEGAKENYELAKKKGLLVGAAPDCYMGSAWQTARKLLDDGYIGQPLVCYSMCMRGYSSHERGPMPEGFVRDPMMGARGTTITYDMGGYYINVLLNLFGAVKRVSGYSQVFTGDREYYNTKNPNYGKKIPAEGGENLMLGALEFENGVYGSLVLCSESFNPEVPRVDIYGTEGHMSLPDPNYFGGWGNDVIILQRKGNGSESFKIPFTHGFSDTDPSVMPKSGKGEPCHNSWRGVAVVDMAYAIRRGRPARSSAELALHTVEIIDAIDRSNEDDRVHTMASRPERPAPLKPGYYGNVNVMEASLDS
ncbi:MAG TPA: Gfo/Idh/MocA family oxidoreductase [Clostridia bacterium]|nr:Gfo/Idh/MocA family oxidoreductase [Clostridia bacterium]